MESIYQFPLLGNASKSPAVVASDSLNPIIVIDGYKQGFFPWYEENGAFFWYAYNPRCVLFPSKIKISRSMRQVLRSKKFSVTFNTQFESVMALCASTKRRDNYPTWINENFTSTYHALHAMGVCKSLEVWHQGVLVGGLYGTEINNVFCGESMFHHMRDASKVALIHLCLEMNYCCIDCQVETPHLLSMGAEEIPIEQYLALLR